MIHFLIKQYDILIVAIAFDSIKNLLLYFDMLLSVRKLSYVYDDELTVYLCY